MQQAFPEQKPLYTVFATAAGALAHRQKTGCGGWIFVRENAAGAVLFDLQFTAGAVMRHQAAAGNGRLL